MTDQFATRVGAVLSADIAVPEHQRVVGFYAHVLTTGDVPLWREDLMNNRGIPIIGVGARSTEYAELPLQWMPHIQVADVARSVERALELGGSEAMHERDGNGVSQWAVLLDPDGAAFGLIQHVSEDDASSEELAASPDAAENTGCIAWLDLTVPNAAASRDFYQEVVGWSAQDVDMEDTNGRYADYNMLGGDGNPAAGVCHARGVNVGLPPVWLLYLPVGDIAESLRRVRGDGGTIIKDTTGTDEGYAYGVVRDPVGAFFALVPR